MDDGEKELLINVKRKQPTSLNSQRRLSIICTAGKLKQYVNELKGRMLTFPTFLLLFYSLPAFVGTELSYNLLYGIVTPPDTSCVSPIPEVDNTTWYSIVVISFNSLFLLVPVVGWLSDTVIGRHRALNVGLWMGWFGTLLQSISGCLQYSSCHTVASVGRYGLSGVAILCLFVSSSFSYAIILAYGMDQLIDAPSAKLRAYIYWYVWALFVGENSLAYMSYISPNKTRFFSAQQITSGLIPFILFTLALCLHFKHRHRFETLKITNPYRTVYNVLKYAIKNKHPRNRSSMTYWETEIPSRIDLAKDKYGGPFTHESVETVKTFLRILFILTVALVPFLIAGDPFINGTPDLVRQFKGGSESLNSFASFTVWYIGDNVGIVLIPLLELVLLPLFPKLEYFLMKPLKGVGIAMSALVLSIISLCVFDLIGRSLSSGEVPCYLLWTESDAYINLSYWIMIVPAVLAGIADLISNLCILEFICSQAPRDMCGMLIGLYFFVRAISINVASVSTITLPYIHLASSHCTSWLSAILGGTALFGLISFIFAAKWYVKRVRTDDLTLRMAVEEHFEQQLIKEADFINETLEETIIISY